MRACERERVDSGRPKCLLSAQAFARIIHEDGKHYQKANAPRRTTHAPRPPAPAPERRPDTHARATQAFALYPSSSRSPSCAAARRRDGRARGRRRTSSINYMTGRDDKAEARWVEETLKSLSAARARRAVGDDAGAGRPCGGRGRAVRRAAEAGRRQRPRRRHRARGQPRGSRRADEQVAGAREGAALRRRRLRARPADADEDGHALHEQHGRRGGGRRAGRLPSGEDHRRGDARHRRQLVFRPRRGHQQQPRQPRHQRPQLRRRPAPRRRVRRRRGQGPARRRRALDRETLPRPRRHGHRHAHRPRHDQGRPRAPRPRRTRPFPRGHRGGR